MPYFKSAIDSAEFVAGRIPHSEINRIMPDYDTLLKQICELLDALVEEDIELREESDFVADLGFDSLKVMKLLEKVEDHYDISIPLNILPDIQTIKDFVLQLEKLMVS